jgi:hypothetical protein
LGSLVSIMERFQIANCLKFEWTSFLPMTMKLYRAERILKYQGRGRERRSCITSQAQGQQMWW